MNILVIDNNPATLRQHELNLKNWGHTVSSSDNGLQACSILESTPIEIIVFDWMMPEMDGLELCRAIRKNTYPGYIFIILLTAKDSKDDIIRGLRAGADDYLTKPFSHAELVARLNTGKRVLELERSLKDANEEIRILSITDPLTGTYNRGYMTERLPQEIKRARRYSRALSIILCDIDHFKKVNDTYGHLAGDRVLKDFARCIRHSIRQDVDWTARYGGEEFLIVLPETDVNGASVMAERLKSELSQRVTETQGKQISITASFGVVGFGPDTPDEMISPEAMISKADKYLYQAKREGRNRAMGGPLD